MSNLVPLDPSGAQMSNFRPIIRPLFDYLILGQVLAIPEGALHPRACLSNLARAWVRYNLAYR